MNDCCPNKDKIVKKSGKAICPECNTQQNEVSFQTVLFHTKCPENQSLPQSDFYFCSNPQCAIVYFNVDGRTVEKSQVRGHVGQKRQDLERTLCYCFGLSQKQFDEEVKSQGKSPSKDWIIEQTRNHNCACEIRNPSGRCCLKDF